MDQAKWKVENWSVLTLWSLKTKCYYFIWKFMTKMKKIGLEVRDNSTKPVFYHFPFLALNCNNNVVM